MPGQQTQRAVPRHAYGRRCGLPLLWLRGEDLGRRGGALGGLRAPEADGGVGGCGDDAVCGGVDGDVLDCCGVAEELGGGRDSRGGGLVGVGPETERAVHGRGGERLAGDEPFRGLDGGGVAGGFVEDLAGEVPDARDAVVGAGEDAGFGAEGGGRHGGDPVVVLEGGLELWRDDGAHVFEGDDGLGGEAVLLEVGVEGGAQEGAGGEEVEGDGRGGVEEVVDDLGEAVPLEAGGDEDGRGGDGDVGVAGDELDLHLLLGRGGRGGGEGGVHWGGGAARAAGWGGQFGGGGEK